MIYTYDGIKAAIEERLSLMSQWNKILFYGVYQRIIDLLAYTSDNLIYLAEFLYRESKWITATKRDSLVTMARWMRYVPFRKTGGIGRLKLSADPTFNPLYNYMGKNVTIQKWHRFTDPNDNLNVYCSQATSYLTGQVGNINIPIKEGNPKEFLYIAKGEISERVNIYSDSIDNDIIDVYIVDSNNNILHTVNIVDTLYLVFDVENYSCEIRNSSNNEFISVIFGDGINARKLNLNERVLVKYAETLGDQGSITSANILTKSKDIFYDEDGAVASLYVSNDEAVIGGTDIENIESIRNNAPNIFQVGMILSSIPNWVSVINSAPFVNKSKVWSIESLGGSLDISEQNIVYITAVSNTGGDLTSAQQNELLETYLIPKKSLTEIVEFFPLQKIYAKFNIKGRIQNRPISIMNESIRNTILNEYGVFNTDFQQNIYESNFISLLDNVPDMVWHESEISYLEKNLPSLVNNRVLLTSFTTLDTSILENQQWLVDDSFEIWLKRKIAGEWGEPLQIAYTTTATIVGMNGFNILNGFVVYSSNQYSYNVVEITNDIDQSVYGVPDPGDDDPLGYILYIAYKMKDGNGGQINTVRLPRFYQITDIDVDFIDTDLSYPV